jgi:leucine-rich repeat protein SHOC2
MKMFRLAIFLLALCKASAGVAQLLAADALDSTRIYTSIASALQDPKAVHRLDLRGQNLRELPADLAQCTNLNVLVIDKNRLRTLPVWLGTLVHMQVFSAAHNKLDTLPDWMCQWTQLRRLDLSRNALTALPACLGRLKQLATLDLWSNDLYTFPKELGGMEALREMDLRAIQFEQEEMDRLARLLPRTKIHFSPACNCGP